jgi:DNA-binding MarR family transcriptional regulator
MTDTLAPLDAETKAMEAPFAHETETRLWLRLLTCTNLIEGQIRANLRESFDVTLPRFDLMAQLDRAKDGMTLSELSQRMMVTNGNVTHVVDKLVTSGDVARETAAHDRRVQIVRLTPQGRAEFRRMAKAHADWLAEMFSGLSPAETVELMRLLARIKASVRASSEGEKS